MSKRANWVLLGFCLGVLAQDDAAARVAYDVGQWVRCVAIECPPSYRSE